MIQRVPHTAEIELTAGARLLRLTETAAHAIGARLCYGESVQHGDRTVIPVARVLTAGGLGFGNSLGAEPPQEGGGGGGLLGARPVGFIEIADGAARFRRIVTTADVLQVIGGAAVVSVLVGRARRHPRR
jgi:uncharacterized spore protein YtfJ